MTPAQFHKELLRLKEFRLSKHFKRWEPTMLYTLLRKSYDFPWDRYKRVNHRAHFCSYELDFKVGSLMERLATLYDPMDPFGFRLKVEKSKCDHVEAGYGVFIEGTRRIGDVVAFYPGKVYPYYSMYTADSLRNTTPKAKGRFVIVREDHSEINGDPAQFPELRQWCSRNPLARGHLINHPPLGTCPNVVAVSYDYTIKHPPWLIPNSYAFQLPDKGFPSVKGLIFLALRDLKDEELYLDYELAALPFELDWYWPVPPIITAKVLYHVQREDINHQNPPVYEYGPLPDHLERVFRQAQEEWEAQRENFVRAKMLRDERDEPLRISGHKEFGGLGG